MEETRGGSSIHFSELTPGIIIAANHEFTLKYILPGAGISLATKVNVIPGSDSDKLSHTASSS